MNKFKLWLYHFFNPYQIVCYWDRESNQFFTTKFGQDNGVCCSGFTNFHADAFTTIRRQVLSYRRIAKCLRVGAIDRFPYAELNKITNAWCVKGYR